MSVHRETVAISASKTATIAFGNRSYTHCAFYTLSGTSSGAIKVYVKGIGGQNYLPTDPNRIDLSAGVTPYRVADLPMDAVMLISSGTASNTTIMVAAWNEAT